MSRRPPLPGIAIALITLAMIGCDSTSINDGDAEIEFVLTGAITTDFAEFGADYEGSARFSRTGIANRLEISLLAQGERDGRRAEANVSFRFAYASNTGALPPGQYTVVPDEDVASIGEATYQLSRSGEEYSRYMFNGTRLRLDVEESDRDRLVASFSIDLDQTEGEMTVDGQQISVDLAGPVRASGSFDLPMDGIEMLPGV